ncbi:MAG TPA: serine hydrolase domain-containing protein, partial [Puia sp.]|nr:serine hydrolase domain-containing protein [Puia sp.]
MLRNGQKEFEFNGGTSSFENPSEINAATLFNACSFTKTFTALATMQCIEFAKLALDDPASRFIESYPYNEEITIRQLLSHSSGVPNPIPLKWVHP